MFAFIRRHKHDPDYDGHWLRWPHRYVVCTLMSSALGDTCGTLHNLWNTYETLCLMRHLWDTYDQNQHLWDRPCTLMSSATSKILSAGSPKQHTRTLCYCTNTQEANSACIKLHYAACIKPHYTTARQICRCSHFSVSCVHAELVNAHAEDPVQ